MMYDRKRKNTTDIGSRMLRQALVGQSQSPDAESTRLAQYQPLSSQYASE
jgi:hypothetical protein